MLTRTAVNVTGDAVASVVMDRLAVGHSSADQQREAEARREAELALSGNDVDDVVRD